MLICKTSIAIDSTYFINLLHPLCLKSDEVTFGKHGREPYQSRLHTTSSVDLSLVAFQRILRSKQVRCAQGLSLRLGLWFHLLAFLGTTFQQIRFRVSFSRVRWPAKTYFVDPAL